MKNIEDINKAAVSKILTTKKIPEFSPGDTIKVGVRIVEGKKGWKKHRLNCLLPSQLTKKKKKTKKISSHISSP